PTLRAITALNSTVGELYIPMIPGQVVGLITVFIIAGYLGSKEKQRLGISKTNTTVSENILSHNDSNSNSINIKRKSLIEEENKEFEESLKRPHLFWVNIILVIVSV